MLRYYHGSDINSIKLIRTKGADVSLGCGELGRGFYVGSSLWRAFSWAWIKSKRQKCGVIEYQIDEATFLTLVLLCKNRDSTHVTYNNLKSSGNEKTWVSNHDAIWAPIVGKNVQDAYQIKFESVIGEYFINQQKKKVLWS